MIPITTVDANSVTFKGAKKIGSMDASIEGTVDRITKRDAAELSERAVNAARSRV
jgi:hypothetical protein